MAYTVEFLETAIEELADLPKDVQRQILRRIEGLRIDPRPAGVKQLKATEKFLRLRVGNHRVIYVIEGKNVLVLVVKIGDRKDIYDQVEVPTRRVSAWRRKRR
ncbi:MAG: type II toxin-antitoxin system RelE/ParE family toxin [Candidatus Rokuibacteriota bacterium]